MTLNKNYLYIYIKIEEYIILKHTKQNTEANKKKCASKG